MAWGDRFYAKLRVKVEQRVGEPVEVIGVASRSGAMGALIAGSVLRGAETAMGSAIVSGSKAPSGRMRTAREGERVRLPMSFIVALTPTALRVFKWRKTWFGAKVKKELGALPRDGLLLEINDGGVVKRFRLEHPNGAGVAFEMSRVKFTTRFADQLTAALADPTESA
jgi:hypothetical protein